MRAEQAEIEAGALIGGCYRVEAEIGQGGTARVYRVLDERTDQRFALKRLLPRGDRSAAAHAMFEREYHTLVQLRHPRIIRAFDYGFDGDAPYYTMELLDGVDARTLARQAELSVAQVCSILRDVASALALVHSRRLIHRDVSPRNVWCTPDGRAKLLDFGTLVAMGPQTRAAGTPPFVPPDAFYLQPLDARCDLYALGALAYYLLTRRYGYPARDLRDLPEMWERRPPRPEALRPELPSALCELVMALTSLDARGRPSSAAEVLERLSAIAELPHEDERHAAQAFLTSPSLVGRDAVVRSVRKSLRGAKHGRGRTHGVVAPAGLGRSRLLAGLVLEARLAGGTVIALDAGAVGAEPLALVALLAERLLEAQPGVVPELRELVPVLSQLSPELSALLGNPPPTTLPASERRRRLGSAVAALVLTACRQGRLTIAVDDVHRADPGSLEVLARLSLLASSQPLVLITTCEKAALALAPPALSQLLSGERQALLGPLSADATRELVSSLFGEIAGLDEAASFLHELSGGSPQACMQYAQYLVDHGIARYEGGRWALPPRLREQPLPATLGAMLEARLSALSDDARTLALGLALARDDSRATWQPETHVRLEDFGTLLGIDDGARAALDSVRVRREGARTFAALDELLRAGLIEQRDQAYVLAQRVMADALVRRSDEAQRAILHERLAAVFDGGAYGGTMLAIRQLQRAGRHARARQRLVSLGGGLGGEGAMDWGVMRVSVAAECTQRALADFEQHGGTPREGILLRRILLLTSSVYDWSLARYGAAQLDRLRADAGLVDFDRTDPTQPVLARVVECLKRAQEAYDVTPEAERGFAPVDAVRELASCAVPLQAAFVNAHDLAGVQAIPRILEPLRPLSPLLAVIADLCELMLDRALGRELGERVLEVGVNRLLETTALPEVLRLGAAAINGYTQALADARKGNARAFEHLDRIAVTVGDDMFLIVHGRYLAHAFRGEAQEARALRRQLEVISEDDVWRRKASLFIEAELHALTGDLPQLHIASEALAELTRSFEGFQPWANYARAAEHRLRGELGAAQRELEAALALARPGEHRAYLRAAPAHAAILLRRGETAAALRAAEEVLTQVTTRGLDRTAEVAALRVIALAHAAAQRHQLAREQLDRALALAQELDYAGLPLAVLHEAEARIALRAGDAPGWVVALSSLHGLLEHAHAPSLIQAYEALREEGARTGTSEMPAAVIGARTDVTGTTETDTQISSRRLPEDKR